MADEHAVADGQLGLSKSRPLPIARSPEIYTSFPMVTVVAIDKGQLPQIKIPAHRDAVTSKQRRAVEDHGKSPACGPTYAARKVDGPRSVREFRPRNPESQQGERQAFQLA